MAAAVLDLETKKRLYDMLALIYLHSDLAQNTIARIADKVFKESFHLAVLAKHIEKIKGPRKGSPNDGLILVTGLSR